MVEQKQSATTESVPLNKLSDQNPETMRSSRRFLNITLLVTSSALAIVSLAAVPFRAPAIPASTPVNAMWSYENSFFVLWIYGEKSSCPETRRNTNSVLIVSPGAPPADKDWKHMVSAEIPMCLRNAKKEDPASCSSGELNFEYVAADKEYRGEYEFEMTNGTKEAGVFRAQYCPIGN